MKIGELDALLDRFSEDTKKGEIVLLVDGRDYEVKSMSMRSGCLVFSTDD